jgi:hypothetical protein
MKTLTNLIVCGAMLVSMNAMASQGGGGSTGTGHIIGGLGSQPSAKAARTGGSWVELLRAALAGGKRDK